MPREIETYLNSLCLSALLHPSVQDALCLEPARHWLALYRLCRSVAVGLPVVSPALVAKDRLGCRGAAGFSAVNVLEASRKIPDRGCAQGQIRKGQGIV